uniref:Coiled-coil-helix-coiled-coil-helix domain containing 10 n=1 Tax=Petromyzon marinus TaxID=7757 RepID=S4RDS2_PETMA
MFRGSRTRQSRGDPPGAVRPSPSPYPHPPLQPLPPPPATPQQPSLLAQMASTAAGVAIGSSVGHVVGNVLTGALKGGSGSEATEAQHSEALSQVPRLDEGQCLWELRQFMECAQGQRDPALCASLGEALRHCKLGHGRLQLL